MKRSSDSEPASILAEGIWLPANGCPVSGSNSGIAIDPKFPARIASVGTVAY